MTIRIQPGKGGPSQPAPITWDSLMAKLCNLAFPSDDVITFAVEVSPNSDKGLAADLNLPCYDWRGDKIDPPTIPDCKGAALLIANDDGGYAISVLKVFLTERALRVMAWSPTLEPSRVTTSEPRAIVTFDNLTPDGGNSSLTTRFTVPYAEIDLTIPNTEGDISGALQLIKEVLVSTAILELLAKSLSLDTGHSDSISPYEIETGLSLEWTAPIGRRHLKHPGLTLRARVKAPDVIPHNMNINKLSSGETWTSDWIDLACFRFIDGQLKCASNDSHNTQTIDWPVTGAIRLTLEQIGSLKTFRDFVQNLQLRVNKPPS